MSVQQGKKGREKWNKCTQHQFLLMKYPRSWWEAISVSGKIFSMELTVVELTKIFCCYQENTWFYHNLSFPFFSFIGLASRFLFTLTEVVLVHKERMDNLKGMPKEWHRGGGLISSMEGHMYSLYSPPCFHDLGKNTGSDEFVSIMKTEYNKPYINMLCEWNCFMKKKLVNVTTC